MSVLAQINYVSRRTPAPTTWYVDPPKGTPVDSVEIEPHEVTITDLRDVRSGEGLNAETLTAVHLTDGFTEFDDEEAVKRDLFPRMHEQAQALLGDCLIVPWSHAVRRRPRERTKLRSGGTLRQPLLRAHCDFTPRNIGANILEALGPEMARKMAGRPYRVVNFWRAITGPLRDNPLAICAPESVEEDDLVTIRHIYKDGEGEIFGVAYNPAHRWFYMSDMEPGDALMFTQYDSAKPATSPAPHTAFALPDLAGPVVPRASSEFRLIVFPEDKAGVH